MYISKRGLIPLLLRKKVGVIMEKEQLISTVSAAQNGDNDALNTLFNEYYNDLYYFALKTVKDDETALDVTQEAFVEIINTLSNLKEPAAFVTWAKQITYHQCTRYFKKKKDVLVDEDEDGNTVFDTLEEDNAEFIPDEALDKSDFKKTVLAILDELSEEQRSATMMYYFDEMSVRQIAEIQGVSEGTVKSRLNYARKAIKMSVEEYEKKNNIKLHALPFFPFFKWLFESSFKGGIPLNSAKIIAEGVGTATGTSITVATATTAAVTATAVTTTATAVGIGAKIAALPLVTKIIAGIVAASIAIGGTTAAVILTNDDDKKAPADKQTVTSSDDNGNSGEEVKDENEELVLEGIIPEGCIYTLFDGTVLTAGQSFPETCTAGDKVEYGDYLYGYECVYAKNSDNIDEWYLWKDSFDSGDSGLIESDAFESWSVIVKDQTKQTYGKIASKINGKPIKTLYATFFGCKNMTDAPKIPSTITAMTAAFYECTSLKAAPVIPKNVKRIMLAFRDCVSLEGDVEINATLDKSLEWYYSDTFSGTKNKINLTGNTAEEDLILIAKSSDNKNITVNGKKVEYGSNDESDGNGDESVENESGSNNYDDTQSNTSPNQGTNGTLTTAPAQVVNISEDYVSRLRNSVLPNFTNASELSYSNVFWFVFYGIDRSKYTTEKTDTAIYYEIPISVIVSEAKYIFGKEYDFSHLYEYDPYAGLFQAGYVPASGGEDIILVIEQGGAGDDYHPEIKGYTELSATKYQIDIAWYSASSQKPTDKNADYYYNEATGDYWVADRWETMTIEAKVYGTNNGQYTAWQIVSYLKK